MRATALITLLLVTPAGASDWPVALYDPAAEASPPAPADLILPLPCGGAMAFQRVEVPVAADNPLADRPVRLGQSDPATGYSDSLRTEGLRGPFGDPVAGASHYYLARYELTEGQARAILGDCTPPTPADRIAAGGLSWFDAVDMTRRYSEWLRAEGTTALPDRDGAAAFVRLPTEAEWEFAARGGIAVDAAAFPARRYFDDGDMRDHAVVQAPGSGRGRMAAIALRAPNPLGLFDIYGNAEELMLDAYRMTALGRPHGLAGGIVTRGGSFRSAPDQVHSALRIEYPPFDATSGAALAADTFGARFVLAAPVAATDAFLAEAARAWADLAAAADPAADSTGAPDAGSRLTALIAGEDDPARRAALESLQLDLRRATEATQTARGRAARATLLNGALAGGALARDAVRIAQVETYVRTQTEIARIASRERSGEIVRALDPFVLQLGDLRAAQANLLQTYRSALDTLTDDFTPTERDAAQTLLASELAASGQDAAAALVARFRVALATYADRPDMAADDVLDLARGLAQGPTLGPAADPDADPDR
jgi:hypothetical protein